MKFIHKLSKGFDQNISSLHLSLYTKMSGVGKREAVGNFVENSKGPKGPFWGPKTPKNEKQTLFNLFDFLSRKLEMTPSFLFHFSDPYRLG